MMNKKTVILLIAAALICLATTVSFAWQMTKELQDEINTKLEAVTNAPNDPLAHFDLAITYSYTNHVQEGWDELKKVHDLDGNFAPVALDMYAKKVMENPSDWKMRFRLAFALYFSDKKAEAIEEMRNIANMQPKDDPKRIWAYGYMGLIYGEIDKVDDAVKYVKKAIKIDPNVAALHMLLASGYSKKGQGWDAFWEGVECVRLKALGN